MKKVTLFLFISLILALLGSCSSDDTPVDPNLLDPPPNEISSNPDEEVALDSDVISKGIEIEGAIRNTGNPPTPNGGIAFTLSNTTQSAFLKSGFDIVFDRPAGFAGVYIQTKSNSGDVAGDYLDVPDTALRAPKNEDEVEIDVNFANDIPPGKFCYLICVYDEAGNVSDPVEVCVEIEAWAGNPNLVATWNYTKEVRAGETILLGEVNFCEGPETISCSNGSTLTVTEEEGWCYASTSIVLELKEDGSYILTDIDVQTQEFLFNESIETCSIVNEQITNDKGDTEISKGNWAYDEEEKTLTLIEFEDTIIDNETGVPDTIFEENGFAYFTGTTTINGSEMIFNITYFPQDTEVNSDFHFTK